jgi:hypothetical protein
VAESATALEAAIAERMPERTLLGILARITNNPRVPCVDL